MLVMCTGILRTHAVRLSDPRYPRVNQTDFSDALPKEVQVVEYNTWLHLAEASSGDDCIYAFVAEPTTL